MVFFVLFILGNKWKSIKLLQASNILKSGGKAINPFWPQGASHVEYENDALEAEKVMDKPNQNNDMEKKENDY